MAQLVGHVNKWVKNCWGDVEFPERHIEEEKERTKEKQKEKGDRDRRTIGNR